MTRRWRWIVGIGVPLGAMLVGPPVLYRLMRMGDGAWVIPVALAGLAAGTAGITVLPVRRLTRGLLAAVYVPVAYLAVVLIGYELIIRAPNTVRLENRSSVALTDVKVDFGGNLVSTADLPAGMARRIKGRSKPTAT